MKKGKHNKAKKILSTSLALSLLSMPLVTTTVSASSNHENHQNLSEKKRSIQERKIQLSKCA
nr:hypothetical protein [Priestia flexa]WEZ07230.1 hypothetical protein P5663_14350 [Priestia flexa]